MNMYYQFNSDIAQIYGVSEAVFIQNIYWWIYKNEANGRHYHDGRNWTYNSMQAFGKIFPFWTQKQIRRIIDKLVDNGALIKGNFNKISFDRTQWYSLSDEIIAIYEGNSAIWQKSHIHLPEKSHPFAQKGTPIPDINTDINHILDDDKGISKISTFYQENIGQLSPYSSQQLIGWCETLGYELVFEALKRTSNNNAHTWAYVESILRNWSAKNIKRVSDLQDDRKQKTSNDFLEMLGEENDKTRNAETDGFVESGLPEFL